MAVLIRLSAPAISVVAGRPATLLVHVRNTASIVDAVTVDVLGRAGEWSTVAPPAMELLPGAEAPFTIVFNPPADGSVRAGEHVTGIRARPQADVAGSAVEELVVTVGAAGSIRLEVVPRTLVDGSVAEARVGNASNISQSVSIVCEDPEAALDVRPDPPLLFLAPGQEASARLHVSVRKRPARGSTISVPYRLVAQGELGRAQADGTATATRRSLPLGRFLTGLASFAIVAALVAAGLLVWSQLGSGTRVPDVRTLDAASAASRVQAAGFNYAQRQQSVEEAFDANVVIAQDPEPDARKRKGSTVLVTIGVTPLRVQLPDVIGAQEADALSALGGAGFFNVGVEQAASDAPKGRVLSSQPRPGGPPLRLDAPVLIVVSAGRDAKAVPAVAGKSADEAVAALRQAGFTSVLVEDRNHPDVPKGDVIGTQPSGTAELDAPITVVVSDGAGSGAVPKLTGLAFEDAQQQLNDEGFLVGQIKLVPGTSGTVIAQDPQPGTTVEIGSAVALSVGQGTGTTVWTPPPTFVRPLPRGDPGELILTPITRG